MLISMDEAMGTSPTGTVFEAKYDEVNMKKSAVSDKVSRKKSGPHMAKDPTQEWAEQGDGPKDESRMAEVLKKMMAEKERLQDLVATLCEERTQISSAMTWPVERVECLEQGV